MGTPTRLLCMALLFTLGLQAQDPGLREALATGKALWAQSGDREGALAKVEPVVAALGPQATSLGPEWVRVLAEALNWLAILEDRVIARRPQAVKHLETLVELDPNHDIDRTSTNPRLQAVFDGLRQARLCRLTLNLQPEGGVLKVNGKVVEAKAGMRYFLPGKVGLDYRKPGHRPVTLEVQCGAKEARQADLVLERIATTLTLQVSPPVVSVALDGKPLGETKATVGGARPEEAALAARLGVPPDQLSQTFLVDGLGAGEHSVELKAPCHRTKRLKIPATFTTPFSDQLLEPVQLERAEGRLFLSSPHPGGEAFLSGRSLGHLPLEGVKVCEGTYDLRVEFPAGGHSQRVVVVDNQDLRVEVRPKPRLALLGLKGTEDFAGRERLLAQLHGLVEGLKEVACLPQERDEPLADALARLRLSGEAELVLYVQPVQAQPIREVEVVVATLKGLEARYRVRPLEQDPLRALQERLNRLPSLVEPGLGLVLLDVPGQPGPFVLEARDEAKAAGIEEGKALEALGGAPVAKVAEVRALLREKIGQDLEVQQGGRTLKLRVQGDPLELPVRAQELCYPFLLEHLRLKRRAAKGDEAGFLALQEALALMHFRQFDKALEILRDVRVTATQGVSQGTLDYYAGHCLLKLGQVFLPDARTAFGQAAKHPKATLFGPEGPLVAPLARKILEDLKF